MEPPQCSRNSISNSSNNNEDNRRGIRNMSRVSCHVACAIQILCHAILPVRAALNRLIAEETTIDRRDGIVLNRGNSSPDVNLLEELIDFVCLTKRGSDNETNQDDSNRNGEENDKERSFHSSAAMPWNPQRLYKYLEERSTSTLAIDPHNVGDSTRTLSCLLRLLSEETACAGSAWKALLNVSVWEGETRQVLEGRRLLSDRDENEIFPDTAATIKPIGEGDGMRSVERRFLQRIKPAAKNKPMSSPLVLKFCANHRTSTAPTNGGLETFSLTSASGSNWSVIEALNDVIKPQRIQGSSYPWESISPDTYSEQEIVRRSQQTCNDPASRLGNASYNGCSSIAGDTSNSDRNSNSSSDSDSDSDSDSGSNSDCNSDSDSDGFNEMDWITSKRLEIRRIPRVWLLHLDRPQISVNKLRRSLSLEKRRLSTDLGGRFLLFDHVHVPLDLNISSITTTNDNNVSSGAAISSSNNAENDGKKEEQSSSMGIFLRGAIVQVIELDDCGNENEEDWEGGHSVTLLRNSKEDELDSWLLMDDENTQTISEERAIRMIGGVFEGNGCSRDSNKNSDEIDGWTYFAASLLVYSIPGVGPHFSDNEQWKPFQDDIVSSWKDHKIQLAATVASQEAFVGKRIRVKWAKGKFYPGTVTGYDLSTGKHQVTYEDGDVKDYNLAKKTIEWID